MPYVPNYTDEEEKDAANAMGGAGSAAPQATAAMQAPGMAPAPAPGGAALTGSRFVNFDKLMSANQSTSDRISNEVTTKAKDAYGKAREGVGNASSAFQAGVNSGSLGPTKAVETYKSPYTVATTAKPVGGSVVTSHSAGLQQPAAVPGAMNIADARKLSTKTYSGPESLASMAGYGDALQFARTADDYTGNVGTNAGREAIIQRDYGVGRGQGSKLDAALMGAAGGRGFQDLSRFAGFAKQIEAANADSIAEAARAKADTASAATGYKNQVDQYDAFARGDAAAAQKAKEQEIARQQAQANMASNAGHGDLQNTTVSQTDQRLAQQHGLENEWIAAGRPPWDKFVASRKGK